MGEEKPKQMPSVDQVDDFVQQCSAIDACFFHFKEPKV